MPEEMKQKDLFKIRLFINFTFLKISRCGGGTIG